LRKRAFASFTPDYPGHQKNQLSVGWSKAPPSAKHAAARLDFRYTLSATEASSTSALDCHERMARLGCRRWG
jgi:hypothetical protein